MSRQYINGYRKPSLRIYDSYNGFIKTVELDTCRVDGLKEEIEFLFTRHDLLIDSIEKDYKGFHLWYTLDYKEHSYLNNTDKIYDLVFNYIIKKDSYGNKYRINLIPHSEYEWRNFNVEMMNEKLINRIMKGGINAIGMKDTELVFRTKDKLTDYTLINPNLVYYIIETYPIEGVLVT